MATLQKRLTPDEYIRRSEAGEYSGRKTELIDGEVRDVPEGWWHHAVCWQLVAALRAAVGKTHLVVGSSIRLGEDVPQPDAAVFRQPMSAYLKQNRVLGAHEVLMVCEVSDTTTRLDAIDRKRRYATAGIPEYWIVNIDETGPRVQVFRIPDRGSYTETEEYFTGQVIQLPLTVSESGSVAVSQIFADEQ